MLSILLFVMAMVACILGAGLGWPMVGPLVVAVQLTTASFRAADPRREIGLIAAIAVVGTLVESGWIAAGVYAVPPEATASAWLCPLWLTAVWIAWALSLHGWLWPLAGRPLRAALCGAILGPAWYAAADAAHAIYWLRPVWQCVMFFVLAWAFLLPGMLWLAKLPVYRPVVKSEV
jgi:hypothetical protein